jgi:hypothetical protein
MNNPVGKVIGFVRSIYASAQSKVIRGSARALSLIQIKAEGFSPGSGASHRVYGGSKRYTSEEDWVGGFDRSQSHRNSFGTSKEGMRV